MKKRKSIARLEAALARGKVRVRDKEIFTFDDFEKIWVDMCYEVAKTTFSNPRSVGILCDVTAVA